MLIKKNSGLWLTVLLGVVTLLSACSSSKSRVGGMLNLNTDLRISFYADSRLNPDGQQRSSPVFLRLYELRDPGAFERADFIDLYERDESSLGDTLVHKQVLTRFAPGEERVEQMVLKPGTRYVALYAEFLQYQDAQYKVVFPVTENNIVRNSVSISLSGNQISLMPR